MIKCNVTACGIIVSSAVEKQNKEGGKFLAFTLVVPIEGKDKSVKELGLADVKSASKFKEHYINVPLKLDWGIDIKVVRVFAFAGPTLSFNVSSKTKTDGTALGTTSSTTVDTKDFFEKLGGKYGNFDLMLGGGVGVDVLNKIRVKFAYDWGLVNRGNDDIKLHRQQLKLGVAYLF